MELSSLEAFVAVAKQSSFSAAAKKLNLTQPAVSKRVASLEEQLNTTLFNRVAKSISLTAAGKRLLPKAEALLQQADDIQRYAATLKKPVTGRLSVTMDHYISAYRTPAVLKAFIQRYPQVKLDISFADLDEALSLLKQGETELALSSLPDELAPELEVKTIWQDSLVFVVAANHPLAQQQQATLSQLSAYEGALPNKNHAIFRIVKNAFTESGATLSVVSQTNNLESLKALAGAGLVWTVLPETMFDASLIKLPIKHQLSRKLGVIRLNQGEITNAAQQMIKTLDEFAD